MAHQSAHRNAHCTAPHQRGRPPWDGDQTGHEGGDKLVNVGGDDTELGRVREGAAGILKQRCACRDQESVVAASRAAAACAWNVICFS